MKKMTSLASIAIVTGVLLLSFTLSQCTKNGVVAKQLDRQLKTVPDSGLFSPFYDTTIIAKADVTPDVNDVIIGRGVKTIIKENCATASCHGGPLEAKFNTYAQIAAYVTPGNPEGSKLFQLIITNDFDKAMPPVSALHELSVTDKVTIYNWIKNGAKEYPTYADYRPAAIKLIVTGCGSANCHNESTAVGAWARKGLLGTLAASDTTQFLFQNPSTGSITNYCQISNKTLLEQAWNAYKDSVKKFYADTLAYASFRPYKTFGTPVVLTSVRGPLSSYDDILMDIMYPKGGRSNSSVQYTDANGNKFYVKGNYLNNASAIVSRVDSTILPANPYTGVFSTTHQGDMAYSDGGMKPRDIAIVKAWYFADPNIPDVWKYGVNNAGLFKYRKTGNIIKQ